MPTAALPSALSRLDSGVDVTLGLCSIPTPSCSESTLGIPLGAGSGLLCQPGRGSRKVVSLPSTGTRSTRDGFQEGLLLTRTWRCLSWEPHRLFPKGKTWVGIWRGPGWGWKLRQPKRGPARSFTFWNFWVDRAWGFGAHKMLWGSWDSLLGSSFPRALVTLPCSNFHLVVSRMVDICYMGLCCPFHWYWW